jgi:hypothetical protein
MALRVLGLVVVALVTIIGLRLLFFGSFFLHRQRYRERRRVSNEKLLAADLPAVKVQITTRGSPGSTPVIARGIASVADTVLSAPSILRSVLSVEVITESESQARTLRRRFRTSPVRVDVVVLPPAYETASATHLKARALHYMVELRRQGWNKSPRDRTFIVHYDEGNVFEPDELRWLIRVLAKTDKRVLKGPIYYHLEYHEASLLCRAMKAPRPVGDVMESGGVPLHLHGSNLVVDEALENEIGFDIGHLHASAPRTRRHSRLAAAARIIAWTAAALAAAEMGPGAAGIRLGGLLTAVWGIGFAFLGAVKPRPAPDPALIVAIPISLLLLALIGVVLDLTVGAREPTVRAAVVTVAVLLLVTGAVRRRDVTDLSNHL